MLQAGHELVVLEVESHQMCQSGLGPEAELHWEEDKKASLSRCANLKHVFARTARDCPDVTFLTLEVQPHAAMRFFLLCRIQYHLSWFNLVDSPPVRLRICPTR